MKLALRRAGFEPCKVELVFEDQYLWAEAVPATDAAGDITIPAGARDFTNLAGAREAFVAHWRACINSAQPAVVWGAGAKGVTFCTLVDPGRTRIAGLVDINPGKQGRYIPMTGHYVDGPESLTAIAPELVMVMNPNYRGEIEAMLAERGVTARVRVLGEAADLAGN